MVSSDQVAVVLLPLGRNGSRAGGVLHRKIHRSSCNETADRPSPARNSGTA